MAPEAQHPAPHPEVISFLAVRRAVGLIGLALPAALLIYAALVPNGMRPSISEFYHSHMGDVLVGSLVAIGVFLITYKGYDPEDDEVITDNLIANIAGFTVIGVALFPTSVYPMPDPACPFPPETWPTQGIYFHWCSRIESIHFVSAAVFFLMMAVFCLYLFPRGDRTADGRIDWSGGKNRLYLICGIALLASIAGLLYYAFLGDQAALSAWNYVFWFETLGVVAFAIAWLAKGKIVQGMTNLVTSRKQSAEPSFDDDTAAPLH
jgi:hypothetical protein